MKAQASGVRAPHRALTPMQIWGMPLFIGLASAFGLVVALVSDGLGDVASWPALGFPAAIGLWYGLGPPGGRKRSLTSSGAGRTPEGNDMQGANS